MLIWKLKNNKWRHNDVITKNNGKIRNSAKPNNIIYHSKGIDKSYPKMYVYFSLNLSHCVKSYGYFCQIWSCHMTQDADFEIWSCHMTQYADFENFLICPNSIFSIRKSHKISGEKALYFRSYQPKTSRGRGVENTPSPVPLGSNIYHCFQETSIYTLALLTARALCATNRSRKTWSHEKTVIFLTIFEWYLYDKCTKSTHKSKFSCQTFLDRLKVFSKWAWR